MQIGNFIAGDRISSDSCVSFPLGGQLPLELTTLGRSNSSLTLPQLTGLPCPL